MKITNLKMASTKSANMKNLSRRAKLWRENQLRTSGNLGKPRQSF
jgi:hypothetical protein